MKRWCHTQQQLLMYSPTSTYLGNSMKTTKYVAMFLSLILSVGFHFCCYKNKSTEFRIAKSLCKSREPGSSLSHTTCALQCEPALKLTFHWLTLCLFEILQPSGALFWSCQMQTLPLAFARLKPLNTTLVVPLHAGTDTVWRVPRSVFVSSTNLGLEALQSVNVCIHVNIYHVIKTTAANTLSMQRTMGRLGVYRRVYKGFLVLWLGWYRSSNITVITTYENNLWKICVDRNAQRAFLFALIQSAWGKNIS